MHSHSKVANAGLAVLVALVLAACGGGGSSDLHVLKGDGFEVRVPGELKRSERSVSTAMGTVKAVEYTSKKAFSIGYTQLPKGAAGDLHRGIAAVAADVGGSVHDEKQTKHQGLKARDARITGAAGDKGTLFVRTILADDRLYLLQYIGAGDNLVNPPAAYADIVKSLKIG